MMHGDMYIILPRLREPVHVQATQCTLFGSPIYEIQDPHHRLGQTVYSHHVTQTGS